MRIQYKLFGLFLLTISVLIPLILIPNSLNLQTIYIPKIFVLLSSFILFPFLVFKLNKHDRLLIIFIFYMLISILWSDYNISTWTSILSYYSIIFLTYFMVRKYRIGYGAGIFFFIATFLVESFLHYNFIGFERGSINSSYLIGSISVSFLALSKSRLKKLFEILLIPFLLLSARRFLLVHLITFSRFKTKNLFILLLLMFLGITLLTIVYSYSNIDNYSLFLGYRVFEYLVIYNDLTYSEFFLGRGLGSNKEIFDFFSNVVEEHVGIFHNLFNTTFFQFGLVGVVLFYKVLLGLIFEFKNYNAVVTIALAWIMVSLIDSPRDGHWPLGLFLGILSNNSKKC